MWGSLKFSCFLFCLVIHTKKQKQNNSIINNYNHFCLHHLFFYSNGKETKKGHTLKMINSPTNLGDLTHSILCVYINIYRIQYADVVATRATFASDAVAKQWPS